MTDPIGLIDGWPANIVADRHEVTGKWVLMYLTDEQADLCKKALPHDETQCDICGDHHEADEVPRECETGDGFDSKASAKHYLKPAKAVLDAAGVKYVD